MRSPDIKAGTPVFYAYKSPLNGEQKSGYGFIVHGDAYVGTDPAYAIQTNTGVLHVRKTGVEETV